MELEDPGEMQAVQELEDLGETQAAEELQDQDEEVVVMDDLYENRLL